MARTSTRIIHICQIVLSTLFCVGCQHSEPSDAVFGWQDIPPGSVSPTPIRGEAVFGWQDFPPGSASPTPTQSDAVFGWQDIPPAAPSPAPSHTPSLLEHDVS